MKRLLIVAVFAAVVVGALLWSQQRHTPFFVSGFIESHQIRLGSRVGGRIQALRVAEGDRVNSGAPLLELEPFDLRERLAQAQSTLAAQMAVRDRLRAGARPEELAQARAVRMRTQVVLDKLIAGPRPQEIAAQEAKVAETEAELKAAQRESERVNALSPDRRAEHEMVEATRALEVAQANLAGAREQLALLKAGTRAEDVAEQRARLAEADANVALLEAGTRAEDLAQAEAQVNAAQAAVAVLERQLDELTIKAPRDGVIEALDVRPGDLVTASAPVISLADISELWVRAYLPENHLSVKLNDPVALRVDSFPDRRFAGHITFIARDAEFTPSNVQTPEERSRQVFRFKVTLDEGLDVLRPGMSADVFLEPAR